MNLIIFGFKASGKTSLGKMISSYLNCPFVDTDDLIAKEHGLSVREIHKKLGDLKFRELEKKVIRGLRSLKHSVIALGGGTVLDPENVAFLQTQGKLIYLKASFETVCERIFKEGIPSFVDPKDPVASLKKIYLERVPIYESILVECTVGV